jgi:hypothetical protein
MNNIRALISEEKKLVVLWTPKAGCTTAKNIFYNYLGLPLPDNRFMVNSQEYIKLHNKQKNQLPKNLQDFIVIQFCRNPYDRAISSFLTHTIHQSGKNKNLGKCEINCSNFIEFLLALKNNKISCIHCNKHSTKQFMTDKVNDIIKIENLDQDLARVNDLYNLNFKNISFENHSHRKKIGKKTIPQRYNKPYEEYLDLTTISLINEIYQKDIEYFKYEKK